MANNFVLERVAGEKIQIPIAVSPLDNGKIIVHCPGYNESPDGYKGKYLSLANFISEKGLAAVVRADNNLRGKLKYNTTLFDDLRFVIDYVIKNSLSISGLSESKICLMGATAGAGAVASVAFEFPVDKILLMNPAFVFGEQCATQGLEKFTREVYIVQGADARVNRGDNFYEKAKSENKKFVLVPGCDDYFRHELGDKIYSKAPFWAFGCEELLGKCEAFPSFQGGIRLVQKI